MTKYLFSLLILTSLIGCTSKVEKKYTYFGGKIIHPKGCFVVLMNNKGFVDTIPLEKGVNTFLKKYEKFEEGVYRFKHGVEFQEIFMEPKDSLMLRLNTWDFDESLVYSGTNAKRNNLLIETFLQNEIAAKELLVNNANSESEMLKLVDSILTVRNNTYTGYLEVFPEESESFQTVLSIALRYPLYSNLETYARKYDLQNHKKIAANFYAFRENIVFRSDSLLFFGPYRHYIMEKIVYDSSLSSGSETSEQFVVDLLTNTNKEIKDSAIKNQLLYDITLSFFRKKAVNNNFQKAFQTFFELSTSSKDKEELKTLISDLRFFDTNKALPDFQLESPTGDRLDISELVHKNNAVFYFYNEKNDAKGRVCSRFNYLVKKYPGIDFNFIHTSSKEDKAPYFKRIPIKYQFKIPDQSASNNFLSSNFSKLIISNKQGKVEKVYAGLRSADMEKDLYELQKNN